LRRERDAASYRAALLGIQDETIHLAHLVEDLMWLARTDGGALDLNSDDVSVEDLVSDVFRTASPLADNRGITLQVHYEGRTHPTIRCDRRPMRRCLLILLDNAVKFTPTGGSIRIRVASQAGTCRIEVHDSGSGVAEQHLPHIFDRFYQADKSRATSGFGLGLSIAKGIVEAHQGRIGVINNPENGCCFYVELPLNDAQLPTSVPSPKERAIV
jgi:signal transduction histidine kinase